MEQRTTEGIERVRCGANPNGQIHAFQTVAVLADALVRECIWCGHERLIDRVDARGRSQA